MELEPLAVLVRILLGAGIGFSIVLTAIGGGALAIPALTLILGFPASVSVGTASLFSSLTRIYAIFIHFRRKTIDMTLAWLCLAGAIPVNLITTILINRTLAGYAGDAAAYASFQRGLTHVIAGVMTLSVVIMFVNIHNHRSKAARPMKTATETVEWAGGTRWMIVGVGAAIGAIVGATSIGAGVVLVPLLILVSAVPAIRAVGTSIFITLILTVLTAIVYGSGGEIDIQTALLMSLGSIFGVFVGGKVGGRLREGALRIAVATLILFASGLMIFR